MPERQAEADRRTVILHIHGVALDTELVQEGVHQVREARKGVRELVTVVSCIWAERVGDVTFSKGGVHVADRWRIDSAEVLIAVVAAQVASLIATEQPALVKRCAGPGCTLWFVDGTKAHSRLFCSAAACGNRAKVAAFRERQRGS